MVKVIELTPVEKAAEDAGLSLVPVSSGSRYDPLLLSNGDGKPEFMLTDPLTGNGPASLDSPASIICFADGGEWREGVEAKVLDARTALRLLQDQDFLSALIWATTGVMESFEHIEKAADQVIWTNEFEREISEQNMTYEDASSRQLGEKALDVIPIK